MHAYDNAKKSIADSTPHLEYVYDLAFICDDHIDTKKLVEVVNLVLVESTPMVIEAKTETFSHADTQSNVKRLGTLSDGYAELNKRKQLAAVAMTKSRKVWNNRYNNAKYKIYRIERLRG